MQVLLSVKENAIVVQIPLRRIRLLLLLGCPIKSSSCEGKLTILVDETDV